MTIKRVAHCILRNPKGFPQGIVTLKEHSDKVRVSVAIDGLKKGLHGFHVHTQRVDWDFSKNPCGSTCDHFNPTGVTHGGRNSKVRHVGDLGNLKANDQGEVRTSFTDHLIKLRGSFSIIGRSFVVHADRDDLGKGGNEESLKTGNSGKRILCGTIKLGKPKIMVT